MAGLREQINEMRAAKGENALPTGRTGKGSAPRQHMNYAALKKNGDKIRENDRLIDAWCKKEGLVRSEIPLQEKLTFINKAKRAGL